MLYEGITAGEKDSSALIAKMKNAGVTLIYFGGLHTEAGLIMRQSADQGLGATLFSGDGMVSSELASIAGDAVVGTLNNLRSDRGAIRPPRRWSKPSVPPASSRKPITLYAYIAVQIVAAAIEKTGSADTRRRSPKPSGRVDRGRPSWVRSVMTARRYHASGLCDLRMEKGRGRKADLFSEIEHDVA